jgi:flagellar motility protein MotE (MotC chaperone)
MIRFARDFRLIPIVLLATVSLFALKVSGLVFDGGYTLGERLQGRHKTDMQVTSADSVPDYPKIVVTGRLVRPDPLPREKAPAQSWAKEMFNYGEAPNSDITGSTSAEEKPKGEPLKTSEKAPAPPKLDIGGTAYPLEAGKINSPGERAVLERLQDRRQELENRARDLDMRESLLKAAESRVEAKVNELKEVESRINVAMGNRDKAEADRFKGIVSMYESMKPKDAARIFDRLEVKVLIDVATQIKPAKMSEILAQMTSEGAEKLTVELANRASANPKSQNPDQLPKIDGKPNGG